MASPTDQSAILKEVLEAVRTLQLNQVQLASNVDAISGRVNVLAGMKEVRDVASDHQEKREETSTPVKKIEPNNQTVDDVHHNDDVVPQSPSLPATQIEGSGGAVTSVSHARKPSVTSRIILT